MVQRVKVSWHVLTHRIDEYATKTIKSPNSITTNNDGHFGGFMALYKPDLCPCLIFSDYYCMAGGSMLSCTCRGQRKTLWSWLSPSIFKRVHWELRLPGLCSKCLCLLSLLAGPLNIFIFYFLFFEIGSYCIPGCPGTQYASGVALKFAAILLSRTL